ncbi:MAG: FeoA family protein [Chloroflexota bacterium]
MRHRNRSGRERAATVDARADFQPGLRPLSDLPAGTRGIVGQLRGGREFTARVAGMGLAPGVEVEVIQNLGHGPVLVEVRDTHLALGRGEALKISVEPRSEP